MYFIFLTSNHANKIKAKKILKEICKLLAKPQYFGYKYFHREESQIGSSQNSNGKL